MNQKIKSKEIWYVVKQYQLIRERHPPNKDNKSKKNNLNSIDESHIHYTQQSNNIFSSEILQKQPEGFIETARLYDLVGYKIMKNYNPKKQKKKILNKRTDSASSKLSKLSSAQSSSIDREKNRKEFLLQQVQKIGQTVIANQAKYKKNNKNSKFCNSLQLLQNFNKIWDKNEKKINTKLGRNQNSSLALLSSAYRQKIQNLQNNALVERNNNILPSDWLKILREEIRMQNVYSKKFVQKISKIIDCQRKQRLKCWVHIEKSQKNQSMLKLHGQNKLKKQINWINQQVQKKICLKFDKIL